MTVTQTSTFPIIGRLSDLFGRRYFFLVGNLVAFVGLMICGRASSINMLIAGVRPLRATVASIDPLTLTIADYHNRSGK
jgi:MFS family permease